MMTEVRCPWCENVFPLDTDRVKTGWGAVCLECTLPSVFDAELRPIILTPEQFNQLSPRDRDTVTDFMSAAVRSKIAKEGWTGWPEFFNKMKRYLLLVLLLLAGCRSRPALVYDFEAGCGGQRPHYRLEMRVEPVKR